MKHLNELQKLGTILILLFAGALMVHSTADPWLKFQSAAKSGGCMINVDTGNLTCNGTINSKLYVYDLQGRLAPLLYITNGTFNYSSQLMNYAWITPTQLLDVDKEDIETDLNTFVDIAGDDMIGNLNTSGNITADAFFGKIRCENITGGTDTNFCIDATGAGGGLGLWVTDTTASIVHLNTTLTSGIDNVNMTNLYALTNIYIGGIPLTSLYLDKSETIKYTNLTLCSEGQGIKTSSGAWICASYAAGNSTPEILEATKDYYYNYTEDIDFTNNLTNFPSACTGDQFVQGIGSTLTCVSYRNDSRTCGISGVCSTVYQGASTLDSLYVSRGTWADIDNYPTACTGNQYVRGLGDTLTCATHNNYSQSEIQSFVNHSDMNLSTLKVRGAVALSANLGITTITGGGLTDCDATRDKLVWDSTLSTFSCGTDFDQGNTTAEIQAAELDASHDECSEISGCVENAITVYRNLTESDINILGFYNAVGDIPTATPNDGDTTHLSTADHIYDYIVSLNYISSYRNITEADITALGFTKNAGDITAITETGSTPLTFTGCDTGSCAIGLSTDLLSYDTSPQLGGYLDTAGQNIGATTDEIENVYIATNSKIYLGNGQEGEVYYDGSKLVIKVN